MKDDYNNYKRFYRAVMNKAFCRALVRVVWTFILAAFAIYIKYKGLI